MAAAETKARSSQATVKRPAAPRSPWARAPWMEAILADWRRRWPAVFTQPVPLAVGVAGKIRTALHAEGNTLDRKAMGVTVHRWTMQGAYLRAIARGEMRRNLDGSEAGVPDEAARQHAQKLLDERAARQAERERQKQARQRTAAPGSDTEN